jgi:predicted ester cyclase
METPKKNKQFILEYYNALSGVEKTEKLIYRYVNDEGLKNHIIFFDAILPRYKVVVDEMIAEDNKVVVLARAKGTHEGEFNGIPPTHQKIVIQFTIRYVIEMDKIVDHWMISDLTALYEQLGVKAEI